MYLGLSAFCTDTCLQMLQAAITFSHVFTTHTHTRTHLTASIWKRDQDQTDIVQSFLESLSEFHSKFQHYAKFVSSKSGKSDLVLNDPFVWTLFLCFFSSYFAYRKRLWMFHTILWFLCQLPVGNIHQAASSLYTRSAENVIQITRVYVCIERTRAHTQTQVSEVNFVVGCISNMNLPAFDAALLNFTLTSWTSISHVLRHQPNPSIGYVHLNQWKRAWISSAHRHRYGLFRWWSLRFQSQCSMFGIKCTELTVGSARNVAECPRNVHCLRLSQ